MDKEIIYKSYYCHVCGAQLMSHTLQYEQDNPQGFGAKTADAIERHNYDELNYHKCSAKEAFMISHMDIYTTEGVN